LSLSLCITPWQEKIRFLYTSCVIADDQVQLVKHLGLNLQLALFFFSALLTVSPGRPGMFLAGARPSEREERASAAGIKASPTPVGEPRSPTRLLHSFLVLPNSHALLHPEWLPGVICGQTCTQLSFFLALLDSSFGLERCRTHPVTTLPGRRAPRGQAPEACRLSTGQPLPGPLEGEKLLRGLSDVMAPDVNLNFFVKSESLW
jgi:hypothetical protein